MFRACFRLLRLCLPLLLLAPAVAAAANPTDANGAAAESPTFVEGQSGMEFVLVRGGCFRMGSPATEAGRFADESEPHRVCVDDFMISRHEVTNAQYRQYQPGHSSRSHEGHSLDGDRQPVVFVSWQESVDYADWLSRRVGRKFRLPTEAEWEMAARAGEEGPRFWGEDPDQACGYANVGDLTGEKDWRNWARWPLFGCEDGASVSAPVGSYRANPFGLYDMLGNVWEWTADWYVDSAETVERNGQVSQPSQGIDRVLRGGSWYSGPKNARVARRSWLRPKDKCNSLGFRLVLALP